MIMPETQRMSAFRLSSTLLVVLFFSLLVAPAAHADKVWLDNGNYLEGSARELSKTGEVEIASTLGTIRVSASRVTRIERSETIEQRVQEVLEQNPRSSAEDYYDLALECEAEGASTLANMLFEQVLRLDPDHEGARRALGFLRFDGGWATEQEIHERRGEVRFRGEWVHAETKARILEQESARRTAHAERRLLAAQLRADQRAEQGATQPSGTGLPYYPAYPGGYLYAPGPSLAPGKLHPPMPRFRPPQNNDRPLKPPRMEGKTREELRYRNP